MMRICIVIIVCFSLLSTNYLFDTFEEYISEITAKATNLLRGNSFATREFDSNGIPYSNFARIRKKTVSPFYVVHYGLIYSQAIEPPQGYQYLWEKQGSVKYWNVPPKNELVTEQNFFNSVNWVVNKTYELGLNGAHLYYDFDWPYRNLKSGGLKAPWYSGLTDGMALTLLCRAYVITGNDTYKSAAALLYESVIKPVSKGGSLITLQNGDLWIEEYVENRLSDEYQSKVLNGMIYATFGVLDYEQTFVTKNQLAPALFKSIKNNIIKFDPFAEIQALQRQLLSDDWFAPSKGLQMPTTDIYTEDDKQLTVESHLPNFNEKDINISIDKGFLVISAEKHEEEKDKNKKYVVRESSSSFYRRVRLPEAADEDSVEAKMKNGVLKVKVMFKKLP